MVHVCKSCVDLVIVLPEKSAKGVDCVVPVVPVVGQDHGRELFVFIAFLLLEQGFDSVSNDVLGMVNVVEPVACGQLVLDVLLLVVD